MNAPESRKTGDASLIRRLWPYAKNVRLLLLLAAVLMVCEELLPFAGPHLLRKVIERTSLPLP